MYSYHFESGISENKEADGQPFIIRNGNGGKVCSSRSNPQNYFTDNFGTQWEDDNSHSHEVMKENVFIKACLRCVFPGKTFSEEWELLADSFIFPFDRARMCLALFLLFAVVTSLSVIELLYETAVTVYVMCNLVFAFCFFSMFAFVCTSFCKQRQFLFVRIMTYLSCLTYSALIMPYKLPFANDVGFFSPGDRLWELLFIILIVYILIPLPYLLGLLVGILIPLGLATTMIFQWDSFRPTPNIYTISANLVVLAGAGNIIGLVVWCIWNRFTRRLLIHVREYALAGVELEKENEKFDRVLTACFPTNIGASVKADILNGISDTSVKDRIANHESVTMMLVELVGFDRVLMATPPRDKGVMANKLFAKLCELSEGYACACLNADNGWTLLVASGIIHLRSDHARACLHLAFDMLDFVNALSDTAGVPIRLRISVHSGSLASGLVGKQRWMYDAWSHDLVALQKMHESAVISQVQISRETLAYFGNASDIQLSQEPNVAAAAAIADRFVVRPNRPPRLYGFADVLSSFPDRHLLAPTQLLIAALDATPTLNCNQFSLYGQNTAKPSPIQLLTSPVRLPDEDAFALHSIRQLQEDCGSLWIVPTVQEFYSEGDGFAKRPSRKRDELNPCTMCFCDRRLERDFEESASSMLTVSTVACLAIHIVSTVFHCLVLPKTVLFLVLTIFTFVMFLVPLFAMVCNKLGFVPVLLQRSPSLRLFFCVLCLGSAYLTSQLNVLTCAGGLLDPLFTYGQASLDAGVDEADVAKHRQCPVPVYIGTAGLLVICMPMLFTRVLALVKAAFAVITALGFALVIEYTHRSLFAASPPLPSSGAVSQFSPSDLSLLVALGMFTLVVYLQGRLIDRLERITRMWQLTCASRHVQTSGIAQHCRKLLNNVLPEPALLCLVDSAIPIDSYSENQDNIAVAVIALDNLPQPSSLERRLNSTKAVDSFRLLSQLVDQIDDLLVEGRFKDLVKVRSVGAQYVIAVGLYSDLAASSVGAPEAVVSQRLSVAIDFVLAVRQMMVMTNSSIGSEITVHSGISIGSVTCGVIACRTIYFDVFSNTVRTALQMAKTCKPEYVQVSETVYTYTRYLYRYYSRKRMSVEPVGEFFAYRLVGTRAMYRSGPLGLGPLIGSGLTRQGSRESGVSLLSQATSVWSQPPTRPMGHSQYNAQQQPFLPQHQQGIATEVTKTVENATYAVAGDENSNDLIATAAAIADETEMSGQMAMADGPASDQNGHYASTATSSYAYYAGPPATCSGPYQYASAYVPAYSAGRNVSQLSAVPEMDTSGVDQVSSNANNSGRLEQLVPRGNVANVLEKLPATNKDTGPRTESPSFWTVEKESAEFYSDPQAQKPSEITPYANGHISGNGLVKSTTAAVESGQNSPRSQISHYDNNQNGANGNGSSGDQDVFFQRRIEIAVSHPDEIAGDFNSNGYSVTEIQTAMHGDLPMSSRDVLSPTATSRQDGFSKTNSIVSQYRTPSHNSLQRQLAADDQTEIEDDVVAIDQRLAALDELDRKIMESVAQLRSVGTSDNANHDKSSAEHIVATKAETTRHTDEMISKKPVDDNSGVPASILSIPFIDESLTGQQSSQLAAKNGLHAKAFGASTVCGITNSASQTQFNGSASGSRHVLPDLVRPPVIGQNGDGVAIVPERLRSRSADFLNQSNGNSCSMAPMPMDKPNSPPADL